MAAKFTSRTKSTDWPTTTGTFVSTGVPLLYCRLQKGLPWASFEVAPKYPAAMLFGEPAHQPTPLGFRYTALVSVLFVSLRSRKLTQTVLPGALIRPPDKYELKVPLGS